MSKSGTYIYDKELKSVIKISDGFSSSVSNGLNGQIWKEEYNGGYFDPALRRPFRNAREKSEFMKRNNLVMDGSYGSEKVRTNKLCEIINSERKKQGLSSKTESQLVGDSIQRRRKLR